MRAEELKRAQEYLDNDFYILNSNLANHYKTLKDYIDYGAINSELLEMQRDSNKELVAEYIHDYLTYRIGDLASEDLIGSIAPQFKNIPSVYTNIELSIRKYKKERSTEESRSSARRLSCDAAVRRALKDFETLCQNRRVHSPKDVALILEFEVSALLKAFIPLVKKHPRPCPQI